MSFDVRRRRLAELVSWLRPQLAAGQNCLVVVGDPAAAAGAWPGETSEDGTVHRGWDAWTDLADHLAARMDVVGRCEDGWTVRFTPLGPESDLHDETVRDATVRDATVRDATVRDATLRDATSTAHAADAHAATTRDKYDATGSFARLRKFEHPGFLLPLLDALAFAVPRPRHASDLTRVPAQDDARGPTEPRRRALVLGCHQGDEIDVLRTFLPRMAPWDVIGVDRSAAALEVARRRFPDTRFVHGDVRELPPDLGRFDLLVAIDLLQSPSIDLVATLRHWREHVASPTGGLIVGLPCSRLQDGEVRFGPRTKNYSEVDMSLLVRDLATIRRSLHQHGFRTRISGRYDLLVAARRHERAGGASGA